MSWENILKRPMNPNLRSERDKQYKQAIIAYDRDVLTPAFEKEIASQPGLENERLEIRISDSDSVDKNDIAMFSNYKIGTATVRKLGNNPEFILDTLEELYTQAGYKVIKSNRGIYFSQ